MTFADGSELDVDAVIWATGYRLDHSWIEASRRGAETAASVTGEA